MQFFLRFLLLGIVTTIFSIIVTNLNLFNKFEYSNLYDAILVSIFSAISAYFILRGLYKKNSD